MNFTSTCHLPKNSIAFILILSLSFYACNKRSGKPRILVFSKTAGFHHTSIPNGIAAIQKLGQQNNFDVDTTTNADWFVEDSLRKYAAVVFMSTTGNILNSNQETEFERYIQSGGGYAGVHAASDAEYDWGWYGRLVGAYFDSHPAQQEAVLNVTDSSFSATRHLPKQWKRKDEWYNFKKISKDIHVLITIDEASYQGGKNGNYHPMAWYHDYDGGRAFYTELGHTEESFTDPLYLQHLLGGIQYAIGDNKELNFSKATSQRAPEENRFAKTMLVQGTFFEPTEMAILPNLDILIAQRRGEIMRYSDKDKSVKQVGFLKAYFQTVHTPNVNAEEGVLGLTADPDFAHNHYVYIYYSPADTSVNRLSRFEYKNDTIDNRSEKIILQLYSQREICCHTGGSLTFGNDNLLFLSTGDNSTPFDEPGQPFANHGFAPLDDRPGHQQYDSRRGAGNTNDLRGKILRIKIKPDGTYEIPQGNLFPPNEPKARPEIYVMGDRNPYRISFDKKTGYLYWGEVGPDAGADSLDTRGPKGYDEFNQARKAGNFGWPLFIANNLAYHEHDYATNKNGPALDPAHPMNTSRNNTGLQELPPAQAAFIWYPYGASPDFPDVGAGGRTAMAGPVYYAGSFPKETRYPDYYNGKLFIYEWIRGWIKAVTMLPNGDFDKMEPFMEHTTFNAPIDMETGPDGRIYILEYGKGWFQKNPDAGLARIDYISGNRPPKVDSLKVDKTSGLLPLTINVSVQAVDPEKDNLTYIWSIGKNKQETKQPTLHYTINQPGEYAVGVEVKDDKNASSKSNEVIVYAGNEQPKVDIELRGNKSFYFPGKPIAYQVKVTDKGDTVDVHNLFISTSNIQSKDLVNANPEESASQTIAGKNIMLSADCKSCHKIEEKSIGPAFSQVAKKYHTDRKAPDYLVQKIIKGGSGVWGEVAMPAHPAMKENDVRQIVQWVLSLGDNTTKNKSLPPSGNITPKEDPKKPTAAVMLSASYTDYGAQGVRPLSASKAVYLRNSIMDARSLIHINGFTGLDSAGVHYLVLPAAQGSVQLNGIDLTGIQQMVVTAFGSGAMSEYNIEIRTDKLDGAMIGSGKLSLIKKEKITTAIPLQVPPDDRLHDLYIIFTPSGSVGDKRPLLKSVQFAEGK